MFSFILTEVKGSYFCYFVSRLVFPGYREKNDAPPNTRDYTVPEVNTLIQITCVIYFVSFCLVVCATLIANIYKWTWTSGNMVPQLQVGTMLPDVHVRNACAAYSWIWFLTHFCTLYSTTLVQISPISISLKHLFHNWLPSRGLPAAGGQFNELSRSGQ